MIFMVGSITLFLCFWLGSYIGILTGDLFAVGRGKRGRGSVGSKMDETGPYLPQSSGTQDDYETQCRVVLGPEKPSSWKLSEPSEDESDNNEQKRSKKVSSGGSKKKHSKKHKSKEKLRDKKRKKKRQEH